MNLEPVRALLRRLWPGVEPHQAEAAEQDRRVMTLARAWTGTSTAVAG